MDGYSCSKVTNTAKALSQNIVYRVENKFNSPRRIIAKNVLNDPAESLKLECKSMYGIILSALF
jgi:hypothetical protein